MYAFFMSVFLCATITCFAMEHAEYSGLQLEEKDTVQRVLLLPKDIQNHIKSYLIEAWFYDLFNPLVLNDKDRIDPKGKGIHSVSFSRERSTLLVKNIFKEESGDLLISIRDTIAISLITPSTQTPLVYNFTFNEKEIEKIKNNATASRQLFYASTDNEGALVEFIAPFKQYVFKGVIESYTSKSVLNRGVLKKRCYGEFQMNIYSMPKIEHLFTLKSLIAAFIASKKGYEGLKEATHLKQWFDNLDPLAKHIIKNLEQPQPVIAQSTFKNKIMRLLKK